jgi:hypothetical protein
VCPALQAETILVCEHRTLSASTIYESANTLQQQMTEFPVISVEIAVEIVEFCGNQVEN